MKIKSSDIRPYVAWDFVSLTLNCTLAPANTGFTPKNMIKKLNTYLIIFEKRRSKFMSKDDNPPELCNYLPYLGNLYALIRQINVRGDL